MLRALLALLLLAPAVVAADPTRHEWKVNGVAREGLIALPTKSSKAAPVVFGFHGHGGSMKNAANSFKLHELWPEAICVYLQGLPTPGKLTDLDGKRAGWQHAAGDQEDRDLKFFDEVWAWLKKEHKVDEKRVYCTGHSNGGSFTYLLWAKRGDVFAAMAPSAATGGVATSKSLTPKPALIVAGEKDELVKFEWQKATITYVRKLNECETEGKPWEKTATEYPSKKGTPVVTFVHPGTHTYPKEAPALIVKFLQSQEKK
ncbi:alpha/beta hydrolase family esterase [Limnoglobus roseus]|uniref:Esterase n=1 Tax=Limnoglobus roseus TaxID=2598579 RepID=A0A5C1AAB8_9BACT|nr:prolyl oligopeptidase family serine peptidase [Limnoglobus roseus]QEL16151.1 esterase [Limnoglobus roseus]